MAIDSARIQRVTNEGLFYLDDSGVEQFIDFAACHARNLARFLHPETLKRYQKINHYSDELVEKSIQRRKDTRYVADRNIGGDPWGTSPYIEFYTDPPTRFVFETQDAFQDLRSWVEFLAPLPPRSASAEDICAYFAQQTGWLTYDLS